jgi:response regulator RpfG family c-di-GMP phosphodiesterase
LKDKGANVLVVDDEEGVRRLLCRRLSGLGYRCGDAASAREVLDRLSSQTFDLVLLDVRMPGGSGADLVPEIASSYPDTAVIMATAVDDVQVAVDCMRGGALDYLTKPFNFDVVAMSVQRALERKRMEMELREYRENLEQKVSEQAEKIRQDLLNSVKALANALEAKDEYTSGHSSRVTDIAVAISEQMRLPQEDIERIRLAGQTHDIGKIGVQEGILRRPGRLTDEEFAHVQRHPAKGERILTPIIEDREVLAMVRHHHEKYDGTGYPDGLKGEEIPLGARILAVADAYDAMTSERPYRSALRDEQARAEIRRGRGSQFDPAVVDACIGLFREKGLGSLDIVPP